MLTESMEDYLEMVFRLVEEKGYLRAVDLSAALQLQPSSVTKMIQKLHDGGFVRYEKYRHIALTPLGTKYGRFLVWRHYTLKEFFALLKAPAGIEEQVEGLEHYITPKTMALIGNLMAFLKSDPEVLAKFYAQQKDPDAPAGESLALLRAWETKHGSNAS